MDAGPGINFFSIHKERLLFGTLGPLAIPETVEAEIRRKAQQDERFAAAEIVLNKVPPKFLEVLSDEYSEELADSVGRIAGLPMEHRIRSGKDLGEIMVVAHAAVAAERGDQVVVLIDDGGGRKLAIAEAARLDRLRRQNQEVGSIGLISTQGVLRKAAEDGICPTEMNCAISTDGSAASMMDFHRSRRRVS